MKVERILYIEENSQDFSKPNPTSSLFNNYAHFKIFNLIT